MCLLMLWDCICIFGGCSAEDNGDLTFCLLIFMKNGLRIL